MRKIIITAAFLAVFATAFFFYNSQTAVIAEDKDGKCCNTECTNYADCQKQCDEQCNKMCEDCTRHCVEKCNKGGQSQMNNCQKANCQQNSGCGQNMSQQNNMSPAIIKISK